MPRFASIVPAILRRCLPAGAVLVALGACAASDPRPAWPEAGSASHLLAIDERGIDACRSALQSPQHAAVGALDELHVLAQGVQQRQAQAEARRQRASARARAARTPPSRRPSTGR